jgi:hypothetical protein
LFNTVFVKLFTADEAFLATQIAFTDGDVEDVTELELLSIMEPSIPEWAFDNCVFRIQERASGKIIGYDEIINGPIYHVLSDSDDDSI